MLVMFIQDLSYDNPNTNTYYYVSYLLAKVIVLDTVILHLISSRVHPADNNDITDPGKAPPSVDGLISRPGVIVHFS